MRGRRVRIGVKLRTYLDACAQILVNPPPNDHEGLMGRYGNMAEWSKALELGSLFLSSPKGREFEPHCCHTRNLVAICFLFVLMDIDMVLTLSYRLLLIPSWAYMA